jgi:hypothetical protein
MLNNRFKVRYKKTDEIYEVYDIIYSGDDNENIYFLVFIGGYFKQYDSDCFEPYIEVCHKNKTYKWSNKKENK